jgi:AraC-like DNA-binding protein
MARPARNLIVSANAGFLDIETPMLTRREGSGGRDRLSVRNGEPGMSDWSIGRGIASVHLLVGLAGEHGVSPAACLRGSGIAPRMLRDPWAEIEAGQELVVVRNIVRLLGDRPAIGLEAGARYHLTAYGIWGYALLASRTLRGATDVGLRYLDLTYAFARFVAEEDARELRMVLDDAAIPEDCRRFLVERDAAAVVAIHRELFADEVPLRRVWFRFPRPPYAGRFRDYFPGPVAFGQPANLIAIDAVWADRPLPQANEQTARLCEAQCAALLDRRRARARVSARVRQQLLRPGAQATMARVATTLGMAPRSLHRRLAAEGTTFRRLAGEVREALAEEMLAHRMTVEEVAERLGYAEPASFIHAFKRWKGVPPGAYRARARRAGRAPAEAPT